jgi:hypothetical protein
VEWSWREENECHDPCFGGASREITSSGGSEEKVI